MSERLSRLLNAFGRHPCLGLSVLAFPFFAFLSFVAPFASDDYGFMLYYYGSSLPGPGVRPELADVVRFLSDPSRVFDLLIQSYCTHTCRFVPSFLAMIIPAFPRWLFAVMNACVWTALLIGIAKLLRLCAGMVYLLLPLSFVLLLNYDATLWLTGAIYYLWPATWTIWLAVLFLRLQMKDGLLLKDSWLPVVLVPLGFVAAGGHELLGIIVAFLLAAYWIVVLWTKRSFFINGRIFLSLGYGLGILCVVFGPASLHRADSAGLFAGDCAHLVGVRIIAVLSTLLWNPVVGVLLVVFTVFFARLCLLKRFPREVGLSLLNFFVAFGVSCLVFAAGGGGRSVWFLWLATFIVVSALFNTGVFEMPFLARRFCILFVVVFGASVCGVTSVSSVVKSCRIRDSLRDWLSVENRPLVRDKRHLSFRQGWLDRSVPMDEFVGIGYDPRCENSTLAAFYGRRWCFSVGVEESRALYDDKLIFAARNELRQLPGWYADKNLDILVRKLADNELACAQEMDLLVARPVYDRSTTPSLSGFRKVLARITQVGRPDYNGCAADVEIQNDAPLQGYYGTIDGARCAVFRYNRKIPFNLLLSISIDRDLYAMHRIEYKIGL